MRALLIIDLQNDFCPGGALPVPDGDAIVPTVNALSERFGHVLLTQDWHTAGHSSFASSHSDRAPFESIELAYGPQTLWPDHCVQGTWGAAFHPELNTVPAELIVRKGFRRDIDSYSAFVENDRATATGLRGYLEERGIDRLYLVGLATDFCVKWSALNAREAGFDVCVVREATRGLDLAGSVELAWREMAEAGVRVVSAEEVGGEDRGR
jgi:nicotinamidase/pyrazinamidase